LLDRFFLIGQSLRIHYCHLTHWCREADRIAATAMQGEGFFKSNISHRFRFGRAVDNADVTLREGLRQLQLHRLADGGTANDNVA
jgi:hypothetical protein